jgi:hypothetical protein
LLTGAAVVVAVMEEEAVTDLAGEAEDTDLAAEVGTDSVVVTHLADLPAVALVRDSAGRGDFLPVDSLVGEITTASVIGVSVDAIATFTIVGFAILMGTFSTPASLTLDIQITRTITHIRTTLTMGI